MLVPPPNTRMTLACTFLSITIFLAALQTGCSKPSQKESDTTTSLWLQLIKQITDEYPLVSKEEASALLAEHSAELHDVVDIFTKSKHLRSLIRNGAMAVVRKKSPSISKYDIEYKLKCSHDKNSQEFTFGLKTEETEAELLQDDSFAEIVDPSNSEELASFLAVYDLSIEDFRKVCMFLQKNNWYSISRDKVGEYVNFSIGLATGLQYKIRPEVEGINTVSPEEGHIEGNWYYFMLRR